MSCFECGGEGGNSLRLCQPCIDRKNAARDARLAQFSVTNSEPDVLEKLSTSLALQMAVASVIIVTMFAYFFFFDPVKNLGMGASIIFAGMVTAAAASALTYLLFWANMVLFEPMWAVGALIIPGLAYRFVYLRWEQAKLPFLLHLASCVIMLSLSVLFSKTQSVSIRETVLLLHSHTHGKR